VKLFSRYINSEREVDPFFALLSAISIAAIMVVICVLIFLNSSAFNTVKQIKIGATTDIILEGKYDSTSPVNASDIDEFSARVDARLKPLDNTEDFDPQMLSENSLGM
jgi:hypothetical protein